MDHAHRFSLALSKKLDRAYTKMLRTAQNIKWHQQTSKVNFYGDLPKITTTIEKNMAMVLRTPFVRQIGNDLQNYTVVSVS